MIRTLLLAMVMLFSNTSIANPTDFATVANIDFDNKTITRHEARLLFTLKTRYWEDGTKVTVVHLPFNHRDHKEFVRMVLNMPPTHYTKFVEVQVNSGHSSSFVEAHTSAEMLSLVQNKRGAIGYVSRDYLLINGVGHVDVIKIID